MLEWALVRGVELVGRYGHVALILVVFLEASRATRILPTELVVPAGAAVLVGRPPEFVELVGLLTASAVVGSALGYWVFGADERGAPRTYGERVRPPRIRVDRARQWLSRWGPFVLCWGRLLPRVRGSLSAAAGIERTGFPAFLVYSAVGWAAYLAGLIWLVYPGADGTAPVTPVLDASLVLLARFWPMVGTDPVGWGLTFAASVVLVIVAWVLRDTLRGAI